MGGISEQKRFFFSLDPRVGEGGDGPRLGAVGARVKSSRGDAAHAFALVRDVTLCRVPPIFLVLYSFLPWG